jgi:hypothetical protein
MNIYYERIKNEYENSKGDSTALFTEIIRVANVIGLDEALALLEKCVIDKRKAWLEKNLSGFKKTNEPVWDGYQLFYKIYLGIEAPKDGEIAEQSDQHITIRWWNSCPTLVACEKLGLDTKQICKKAYHKPVQEFLMQLNPDLRFGRNYDCIRPYAPYCEETIYLEE